MPTIPGEQLAIRLWETIEKFGVGLLVPSQTLRVGRTHIQLEAERIAMLADAQLKADQIERGELEVISPPGQPLLLRDNRTEIIKPENTHTENTAVDLVQQTTNKAIVRQLREEFNVTKAVIVAERILKDDPAQPGPDFINADFINRWRDGAAQTSSEDMQEIWGRLLANEVKAPGTFSLRTISFIKDLSPEEARDIDKIAPYLILDFIWREEPRAAQKIIPYELLLRLNELGILLGTDSLGLTKQFPSKSTDKFEYCLVMKDKALYVYNDDPAKILSISSCPVTQIGSEILKLSNAEPNFDYLRQLGKHIATKGFTVSLGDARRFEDDLRKILITNQEQLLPD